MPRTKVAILFCLVFLCGPGCKPENRASTGIMIDLATSPRGCGDGRTIVAIAVGDHRARLNVEPEVEFSEVVRRLHQIMRTRAEKVVYVEAEPAVAWGEFVELVDAVWPEVNVVSLITPQVGAMARRTYCISPSCRDCKRFGGFPPGTP